MNRPPLSRSLDSSRAARLGLSQLLTRRLRRRRDPRHLGAYELAVDTALQDLHLRLEVEGEVAQLLLHVLGLGEQLGLAPLRVGKPLAERLLVAHQLLVERLVEIALLDSRFRRLDALGARTRLALDELKLAAEHLLTLANIFLELEEMALVYPLELDEPFIVVAALHLMREALSGA